MIGSYALAGVGRVNAAEADLVIDPEIRRNPSRPQMVLVHSSGGSVSRSYMNNLADSPAQFAFCRVLADLGGWPLIATDMGGLHTFGNPTGRTRIDQAATWMTANGHAAAGKFILIGSSQGSFAALSYAQTNPANVLALVLILTVPDLEYLREQNADGTVRGNIDTDWAVTYPALLPAGANVYSSTLTSPTTGIAVGLTTPAVAAIPMRSYYVSNDQFTPQALEQEFVTAWGAKGSGVNMGALGHTDAMVGAIDVNALAAWLWSIGG